MVFCTEFLDGWWSWQPLRRSCVQRGWCRVISTAHTTYAEALKTSTHPKTHIPPHPGHQQAASSVLYTTSCKYSLVLLRMGEIIARNMLSWLKLLIKLLLLHLVGCLYCCTRKHFRINQDSNTPTSVQFRLLKFSADIVSLLASFCGWCRSGMWRRVVRRVVPGVSKDRSSLNFRVKDNLTLEMKAVRFSVTSVTVPCYAA